MLNNTSLNSDVFAVIEKMVKRKFLGVEGGLILWQVHERVSKNGDAFESGEEHEGASIDPRGTAVWRGRVHLDASSAERAGNWCPY